MAKDEAKVKFTAETSEFTAGVAKANSELTKLRAELKLNATQMKGAGDDAELLAQRQEILAKEASACEAKTEALTNKMEAAKRIYGENSTEANKWETQLLNAKNAQAKVEQELQQLNAELNKTDGELGQAAQAAKKFGGQVEQAGIEAGEAKNSIGELAAGTMLADFGTATLDYVVEKIKQLGTEAEQALNKLDVNTGSSAETMERYKDVMDAVYSGNYGESYEDVADAMSTIVTVMGDMPDDKLQGVTQNALTLADKFDMDVKESVRGVNSMMDQFGISADEAYNLIVQGAQKGLNQNDDLLDTVNEYSVQFAKAGYSADEMLNMLANGAESGTWSVDKLGDAVKEFNIRMTDGTANEALEQIGLDAEKVTAQYAKGGEDAKKATEKVVNALMGVEDEQERYMMGQAIMGTMWEDLGEDAVKSLFTTEGAIDSANDAMGDVDATAYDDVGSKLEQIGRMFETEIVQPVVDKVMPAIEGLADWFIDNFDAVAPVIAGVAVAFGVLAAAMAISGIITAVGAAMSALGGIMALNPFVLAIAAIAGVVTALVLLWNNCDAFREKVKWVWENIKNNATEAWEKTKENVKQAVDGLKKAVTNVLNKIKSFLGKVWDASVKRTKNAWQAIKQAVSVPMNAAKNLVSRAIDGIKTAIDKVKSAKDTVVSVFSGIKSAISDKIDGARQKVRSAIDKIKGMFNFSWSLPKIKLPHFSVSGGKAPWGFGGKGSLPSVSVSWYAKGGVLTKPTIFGAYGNTLLGGGEAGAEAILPVKVLEGFIDNAFQRNIAVKAGEGGNVYNFYVDGAVINDDARMQGVAKEFIEMLVREGDM